MLTDRDVAALTLWAEARGGYVEERIGVGNVLRNRVTRGTWGPTYTSVCRAPAQFSCWNASEDENHVHLMGYVSQILAGLSPRDSVLDECYWIVDGVMSGKVGERVGFATHYFDASIAPPAWTVGARHETTIGRLSFWSHVS